MTSITPLIGLTTYGRNADDAFALPAAYVDAVRRAGGIPILLPPGESRSAQLMQHLDGLILTGGGDIDPALYASEGHETVYMVDKERDETEIAFSHRAISLHVPLLGICRGTQMINVALGGTLIEHLPDSVGTVVEHRLPPREPTTHPVEVVPHSRLAHILYSSADHDDAWNVQALETASWHHQAIRRMAPDLQVAAYAPDGTIEAVESTTHPWLIAVQWHPELTAHSDPAQQRLFDALVAAASSGAHSTTQVNGMYAPAATRTK